MSVSAAGLWRSKEWRYRLAAPERDAVSILANLAKEEPKPQEVVVFDASIKVENSEKELVHE